MDFVVSAACAEEKDDKGKEIGIVAVLAGIEKALSFVWREKTRSFTGLFFPRDLTDWVL